MADITLTPQEVVQAEAQQKGLNSIPDGNDQGTQQIDYVPPAARLDMNPDENHDVTLQEQIQRSSDTSVGFTPKQLDQIKQLVQPGQQEQPQQPSDPNGLPRLDELAVNNQPTTQPETPAEVPQPTTFELPDDESAKKFKQAFENYLGFPLEDLKTYSEQFTRQQQELAQIRQDNYERQSIQTLSQEWGVPLNEAQSRLSSIKERFKQYDKSMQDRLDNLEGAKLIWSRLELERSQQPQVPQFQRSSGIYQVGNTSQYQFTEKELDSMPRDEYERRSAEIYRAYEMGLVQP